MLAELGARAERYALDDPNTSMIKVRQLGELLAKFIAAKSGVQSGGQHYSQRDLIEDLFRARAIPAEIKTLFHTIRMEGNGANHAMEGHQGQAITLLRHARNVGVWYYRSHVDGNEKLGGVAQKTVTLGHLRRFSIPHAPLGEQKVLLKLFEGRNRVMGSMSSKCEQVQSSLDQSILSKAFRGKLGPQDPSNGLAAELLARIRATRESQATKKKVSSKKSKEKLIQRPKP